MDNFYWIWARLFPGSSGLIMAENMVESHQCSRECVVKWLLWWWETRVSLSIDSVGAHELLLQDHPLESGSRGWGQGP